MNPLDNPCTDPIKRGEYRAALMLNTSDPTALMILQAARRIVTGQPMYLNERQQADALLRAMPGIGKPDELVGFIRGVKADVLARQAAAMALPPFRY